MSIREQHLKNSLINVHYTESEIALPTNIKSGNYIIGITNESAGTIYSNQLIIE
jgi:hypothetical protein